jgi:putative membrane protein
MSKKATYIILLFSVLVPFIVAFLLFIPGKISMNGNWQMALPHLNGIINTITAIILVFGFIMIRNKRIEIHKRAMSGAFILGVMFLASYLIYHSTSDSAVFGDVNSNGLLEDNEAEQVGSMRMIYLFILLSHIFFAVLVVPFVLFAFYFALTDKIEKHRNTVRFTLPIWLYVSISGVVVYLLIRPYY